MGKILILPFAFIMIVLCISAIILGDDASQGLYNAIQVFTSLVIGGYAIDDGLNSDD